MSLIKFREYQRAVFLDRTSGVLVLHWSRQIGKSFTLAAWAVDRLLTRPGRLVTVLSNSRDNGAEFVQKCKEITDMLGQACQVVDESPDLEFVNMRIEVRITVGGKEGRIKVLAANPRTARGFSGDLILDEFAFHENSNAIWEAAEPILSSNPDFLCRIASTGNGKHNMFYRMVAGAKPAEGAEGGARGATRPTTMFKTEAGFLLSRVPRSVAFALGVKIYDQATRKPITPEEAQARALDKRAYAQNYECQFTDENMALLTHELIEAACAEGVGAICEGDWSAEALGFVERAIGDLFIGVDVGRVRDLTVITVMERLASERLVRAVLRIQGMRLPDQQKRLAVACRARKFRGACIDMTGLGLGLLEYSQEQFGVGRIQGINFASSVPLTENLKLDGRKSERVNVKEALATELLRAYEDRRIKHPADLQLREDLRKPEKIITPGGRVSIAATRTEAGHADHFWSFALAIEAATQSSGSGQHEVLAARATPVGRGRVWL